MLSKRSSILFSAIGAIFCFLSVLYVSCTKPGASLSCDGVICENGGYCNKGLCICPLGYEGTNCGTASVAKFIGTWDVNCLVSGSDSAYVKGIDSTYEMTFLHTSTPTTFFIDNFLGNPNYNQVVCILDTSNSNIFTIDTTSFDPPILYDHLIIEPGSGGIYNPANKVIYGTFYIMHINHTYNWQLDTLTLTMSPHKI